MRQPMDCQRSISHSNDRMTHTNQMSRFVLEDIERHYESRRRRESNKEGKRESVHVGSKHEGKINPCRQAPRSEHLEIVIDFSGIA